MSDIEERLDFLEKKVSLLFKVARYSETKEGLERLFNMYAQRIIEKRWNNTLRPLLGEE